MILVQKFGGTSLSGAEGLRTAAETVAETRDKGLSPVVVVSARGKTSDRLIDEAEEIICPPPARELDALLSTGELSSAAFLSMQLIAMGYDCVSLSGRQAGIMTDSEHGSAKILGIDCDRIRRESESGRIVVVTGFQGIDLNDDITTLGRGGSDLTATALASALECPCEIYTDVDGIYTADPRLINTARKLDRIDYRDMLKLAENGSQVLMARSVLRAMEKKIELWLKASGRSQEGTEVCFTDSRPDFCGVTRNQEEHSVCLVGKAVSGDTAQELYELLEKNGIAVLSMMLRDGVLSATVPENELLCAMRLVHARFFE